MTEAFAEYTICTTGKRNRSALCYTGITGLHTHTHTHTGTRVELNASCPSRRQLYIDNTTVYVHTRHYKEDNAACNKINEHNLTSTIIQPCDKSPQVMKCPANRSPKHILKTAVHITLALRPEEILHVITPDTWEVQIVQSKCMYLISLSQRARRKEFVQRKLVRTPCHKSGE